MTLRARASLFSLFIIVIALLLAGLMAASIQLVRDIDARAAKVSRLRADIILAETLTTEVLLDGGRRPVAQWQLLSGAIKTELDRTDGMLGRLPGLRDEMVSRIEVMDQAFARLVDASRVQSPTVRAVLVMQVRANKGALLSRLEEIEADLRAETSRTYTWLIAAALTAIGLLLALAAGQHWLTRRYLLSAFEEVSLAVRGIAAGHLEQSIVTRRGGEIGDLLASLDDMRARLRQAMTRQEQERRKAEELSRAKSDFVASVSHELRTPLTGLLGRLDLAQKRASLNEVRGDLRLARDAGAHLLSLVNQVLAFSRIEAGHLELAAEPFNPDELVLGIEHVMSVQAARKGLTLTVNGRAAGDGDAKVVLLGDGPRLTQVLLNLVGNAIKFTSTGGVAIDYSVEAGDADMQVLHLAVRDTGPGIPPESRAAIFQEFVQLGQSGDATQAGAGLGLAISARLVGCMGGTIGVADAPGGGAEFRFSLQLPEVPPMAAEAGRQPPARERTLAVLVVEDVAFNRDVIREFLQTAGHRVVEAEDGRQAMERLRDEGPFDVVLMDINMPVMDGLDATRQIRAAGESWSDVPILGLTANAFNEQVRAYVEAGMNGCIAKPVVWDDLFDQLAAVTGTARARVARVAPKAAPVAPAARPAVESPIFDPRQFDDFAAYLGEAQAVRSHVEALEYLKAETAGLAGLLPDVGNIGQIARIAHALRGVAAKFGFTRIAILAGEIETAAQAGPGEQARIAALVAGLADSVEAAMAEAARPDAVSRAGV